MGEKININDEILYKETLKYYQQKTINTKEKTLKKLTEAETEQK